MVDGKATVHAPESQGLDVRHASQTKWSGMTLLFHGKELSFNRLQFPASCILSLSRMADWSKVALGCSTVLLGMFKASRAQVV